MELIIIYPQNDSLFQLSKSFSFIGGGQRDVGTLVNVKCLLTVRLLQKRTKKPQNIPRKLLSSSQVSIIALMIFLPLKNVILFERLSQNSQLSKLRVGNSIIETLLNIN